MRKLICCLMPLIFFGCSNPGFQKAVQVLRNNRYRSSGHSIHDVNDPDWAEKRHDRFKEDMEEEYRRWEMDRMERRIDRLERRW